MSASAWSALADRFAAVAVDQEFDLWLYSAVEHHYPPSATQGELRFTSAAHIVRERTGFTGLALTAPAGLTGDEFLRLNRFRWLAWVAGHLLSRTGERPELEWYFSVHARNASQAESGATSTRLRRVVAASETTARHFAGAGAAGPPVVQRLQPGAWQQPLISLREAFWQHANTRFDFHLELHGYTSPPLCGVGDEQLRRLQEQHAAAGRYINTRSSQPLSCWADSQLEATYTDLAQHAGRHLPDQFIPSIRLLPAGVNPVRPDHRPDPLVAWSEFLWLANPQNYQRCTDPSDSGARKAVWDGGNPFMASALAIDQYVTNYGPDTTALLSRRVIEVCPWFQREDQTATLAVIEAAFRQQSASPPGGLAATGGAPNAPLALCDIRNLLRYQKALADFEEWRRRTHQPVTSVGEYANRSYAMALSYPQPGRLTPERAAGLSVYRRLLSASLDKWKRDLDEQTLLWLVGETAEYHQRGMEEMWPLPLEEFGHLMEALEGSRGTSSTGAPQGQEFEPETARGATVTPRRVQKENVRAARPPLFRHATFQRLASRFEDAAKRFPSFRLFAVKLGRGLVTPSILSAGPDQFEAIPNGRVGWVAAVGEERETAYVCGWVEPTDRELPGHIVASAVAGPSVSLPPPENALRLYHQLATEAGGALPAGSSFDRFLRPICPFGREPVLDLDPAGKWSLFVFNVLRAAGGMQFRLLTDEVQALVSKSESVSAVGEGNNSTPARATYAFLALGMFAASVQAIECAGLGTETGWATVTAPIGAAQNTGTPMSPHPPGVAPDIGSVSWDLPDIFTQATDLAESLECEHDRVSASGDPDRIGFQLRRALNPRDWPFRFTFQSGRDGRVLPGWLQTVGVATCLCSDTKRALESLAIVACDVDGAIEAFPSESFEGENVQEAEALAVARRRLRYARSLLGPSAAALWVVMNEGERSEVAHHIREKARRMFAWTQMPAVIPAGLQRYHDGGRTFDDGGPAVEYRRWRTFGVHEIPDVPTTPPPVPGGEPKEAVGTTLGSSDAVPPEAQLEKWCFFPSGAMWEVRGCGESGHLPTLLGMENLAQLLRKIGQYVSWAELLALHDSGNPRSKQPAFTEEARRAIQEERRRLHQEIDEADNEVEKADSVKRLEAVNAQAMKDVGLGGKARDMNSPIKGYRAKIHGRLQHVYAKMREGQPPMLKLAAHFEAHISSTENGYVYNPPTPHPTWTLDPPNK